MARKERSPAAFAAIRDALRLDANLHDTLTSGGQYHHNDDAALAAALDCLYFHGFADEQCGDANEAGAHLFRLGPFLVETDSQGFVTVEECADESEAANAFASHQRAYSVE